MLTWGYRCERCGHKWIPREEKPPRVCPHCKSPYWDKQRKDAHPVGQTVQEVARTPGVFLISTDGRYVLNGKAVPLSVSHKQAEILSPVFRLPRSFRGVIKVHGAFSVGIRPTTKNAIEEINRLRKPEGLEKLPGDVICEKVDDRRIPPLYRLALSVESAEDHPTSPAQLAPE